MRIKKLLQYGDLNALKRLSFLAIPAALTAMTSLPMQAQETACTAMTKGQDTLTTQPVTVSGNALKHGSAKWVPHGVVSITFVRADAGNTPDGHFTTEYDGYVNESDVDKIASFQAMLNWGADSVRMQISQPASDPNDPNGRFDQYFVNCVQHAVLKARNLGLNVIMSLQDESGTGDPQKADLPNAASTRAWLELAPPFVNDKGVLFELYNEPSNPPSPPNWNAWQTAFNNLTSTLRGIGAKNVMVVDGLHEAETLSNAPLLSDPQTAYAVHPYFWSTFSNNAQDWNTRFGTFSATAPVIVTEWTTSTNFNLIPYPAPQGSEDTPHITKDFLSYLYQKGIGLEGFTFGSALPGFGSIITGTANDINATTPTQYLDSSGNYINCTAGTNNFNCPDNYGPGKMVQSYYNTGVPPNVQ